MKIDQAGRQFCVIFYLGPFFGPFLELEYLGLGGVETYDLFKNPFGALFGAFFRALFNDTELTPCIQKIILQKYSSALPKR